MELKDHEKLAAFRRLTQGVASPAEARRIVRHLIAGCHRCSTLADKVRGEEESSSWDYDGAFDRIERQLPREQEAASPLPRLTFSMAHG